jgi:hypothetical protein
MTEELKPGIEPEIGPGLYYDMPAEQYYGSSALGASKIKAFAESPLHYEKFSEMKDTPALQFGRAVHCYILEGPEVFNREYAVMPEGMIRRGKEYQAFLAGAKGKSVIKQDEFDQIVAMRDALLKSDARDLILREGYTEVSLFWDQDGIQCKGRLDKLIPGERVDIMVDYKTTGSADVRKCFRAMDDYKYWLQEAHYGTGYYRVMGRELEAIFVFQEKTPPYDVCLVKMEKAASPVAYDRHTDLMSSLAECTKSKKFPGRNAGKGIFEWGFREWGFQEE